MKLSGFIRKATAFVVIVASLVGCDVETYDEAAAQFNGGSSVPPPPPPGPPPPPPPPPPPAGFNPTFSDIQANVFTPSCATAGCHSGGNPSAALNLEAANSYAALVGVNSSQDALFQRVNAGNPDASYLVQKLDGTASGGGIMPPGGALSQTAIDVIRQWITDGALDNTVVPPAAPIRVTSLSPAPNAALTAGPTQIVAGFDRVLDVTSVGPTTFLLEGSGGDAIFGNANDVPITAASISVPVANNQSAIFDLTGVVLADDTYRVRLLGTGASVIMDLDSNALDGEFAVSFPSGNAVAGGDFIARFTVATPVVIGPTLDQIQTVVFTPTCATVGCHSGALPDANLDLSNASTSFMQLVGVASTQQVAVLRVAPNDPDNSYLIQKLEGAVGITGVQMPFLLPALDPAVIAEIRQWISDGALQ